MLIAVKEPGKRVRYEETDEKDFYRLLEKYFPEASDHVVFNDSIFLCVDQYSHVKHSPFNFLTPVSGPPFTIQSIYGTVLFVRTKGVESEYLVDDLTDMDKYMIENFLSDRYQNECRNTYIIDDIHQNSDTVQIAVKEPNKGLRFVETKDRADVCVDKYIMGIPEVLFLNKNRTLMLVMLEQRSPLGFLEQDNFFCPGGAPYDPVQRVRGTAVFMRVKTGLREAPALDELVLDSLTDADKKRINFLLADNHQNAFKTVYDQTSDLMAILGELY